MYLNKYGVCKLKLKLKSKSAVTEFTISEEFVYSCCTRSATGSYILMLVFLAVVSLYFGLLLGLHCISTS